MRVFILTGGLILGLVIWWLSHQRDAGETAAAGDPPGAVEPSAERPAAEPRSFVRRPALPSLLTDPPADTVPPEISASEPALSAADLRIHLQARFAAQGTDPGWASTARRELSEDLGRFGDMGVRVHDVECRSSLCRAELLLTSHEAESAFMESWLRHRSWTGPGFAASDEIGPADTPKMIMFLARPGSELPRLE